MEGASPSCFTVLIALVTARVQGSSPGRYLGSRQHKSCAAHEDVSPCSISMACNMMVHDCSAKSAAGLLREKQHYGHQQSVLTGGMGNQKVRCSWARAERTAEQDEQEEEQPGDDVGDDKAAADGAHEAEEVDGRLVRQEADEEEGEVPAQPAQAD